MAFEWTDLIGPALGFGGSVASNAIQAGASKEGVKEQGREFDIKTQRADMARNQLMPNLQTALGQRPSLGMMPGAGGYGAYGAQPQQGGSKLKSILGVAGKAAPSALGMLGIGAAGGPIGMAASLAPMAISAIKNIGAGRKAADRLTGPDGAQGQFGEIMKEIARREGAGQITAEQRASLLAQSLDRQINAGMAAVKNDKDKLVMRQWLGSFFKPEWRDHPQLAAVAQKYLGSLQ